MRVTLQDALQRLGRSSARQFTGPSQPLQAPRSLVQQQRWICQSCREQARSPMPWTSRQSKQSARPYRAFASSALRSEKQTVMPDPSTIESAREARERYEKSAAQASSTVASKDLPSHAAQQRWPISKRAETMMNSMLARAAVASQTVNTFTGTDYAPIEALRRSIVEQEQAVKAALAAVGEAKVAYTTTHTQQASSQKEVVGLLERKQSWSAGDLERYMSLIRSEHINEQAVQKSRDELTEAERALEDARAELEKKERKQYHEEQIWSDTIRRNSTWVTFGLMGLNFVILLGNLAVIEPWRRRRLVREVRRALEENSSTVIATAMLEDGTVVETTEPNVISTDTLKSEARDEPSSTNLMPSPTLDSAETVGQSSLAVGEVLPQEAVDPAPAGIPAEPSVESSKSEPFEQTVARTWEDVKDVTQDLFSERQVVMSKADLTTLVLEGAAAGVAIMGFLFVVLRPG